MIIFYSKRVVGGQKIKMLPIIQINPAFKGDKGLEIHEYTHVYQYLAWFFITGIPLLVYTHWMIALLVAVSANDLLYTFVMPYQKWCEVQAFRRQLKLGGNPKYAAEALSSNYDFKMTYDEALLAVTK